MRAYIHLDNETTTLDATTGHIWSHGHIVTDGSLNIIHGLINEHEVPVFPTLWNGETLKWAVQQYGEEFYGRLRGEGRQDWQSILIEVLYSFNETVKTLQKKGYEVWTISNHPEFDITMMKAAYKIIGESWPIKYNHNLDWQSLYLAWAGSGRYEAEGEVWDYKAILKWADPVKGKENVAHTALADVERQLAVLKNVGVRLPL